MTTIGASPGKASEYQARVDSDSYGGQDQVRPTDLGKAEGQQIARLASQEEQSQWERGSLDVRLGFHRPTSPGKSD